MVQASVAGVVDFDKAELRSATWWRTLWLKLDAYERQLTAEYHRVTAQNALQLSCRLGLADDTRQKLSQQFETHDTQWQQALFAWWVTQEQQKVDAVSSLKQLWIENWGDPDDPEVKKRIARTAALMLNKARK